MRINPGLGGAAAALVVWLGAGSTAVLARPAAVAICPAHAVRAADAPQNRVVRITLYNTSRMRPSDIDVLVAAANQIWSPYGVTMQIGEGPAPGAVAVVLSDRSRPRVDDYGPVVLGTTLFSYGHATPYIKLSLAAAEAFAESAPGPVPFNARPLDQRNAMLMQMLGVAFAHEMAHYLLDTAEHSAVGLLQAGLTIHDLASPEPSRLRLTPAQQRLLHCDGRP